MRKDEAIRLAMQLGIPAAKIKHTTSLCEILESKGMEIGIDNKDGAWVVIRKGDVKGEALTRVA